MLFFIWLFERKLRMDVLAEIQARLFTPNNHSVYEVGWHNVGDSVKATISAALKEHYGWEEVHTVEQVDEYERASNNFRCSGIMGSRNDVVLFRKHLAERMTREAIDLVDRTLKYLKEEGVPVVVPLLSNKGARVVSVSGRFCQVFPFVQGTHYRGTEEELFQFARQLAHLHRMLETIPFLEEIRQKPPSWQAWSFDGWNELFQHAQRKDGYLDRLVVGAQGFIQDAAESCKPLYASDFAQRMQVIHGDLHPLNTLFVNQQLAAFLDFGEARISEPLRDCATGMHRFVRQFIVYRGGDWEALLLWGLYVFLEAYTASNPLSLGEIQILPLFAIDELLRKIFDNLKTYYLQGNVRSVDDGELEKKLTLLKEALIIQDQLG